jgi:hypothetical protein
MKTLTSVADLGLVPFPVWCEGHACPDIDDRQPAMEDANAALLAWYRHLVAERIALDEIVEQARPLASVLESEVLSEPCTMQPPLER